jgi:acetyltransferase-like isoleucine patch superfamily enzyme
MTWLQRIIYIIFKRPYYSVILGRFGKGSKLIDPILTGSSRIFIGQGVYIRKHTWLAADPLTGSAECSLTIGDGTYVGHFCHLYATKSISLGKHVLLADRVYVTDNVHEYQDIHKPIMHQPVKQLKPVTIGDGVWLGENVCIIGASIGKNSVIGANAVVTADIPDYCVAVGSPARIIKRYDRTTESWRRTDPSGHFIEC